MEISIMTDRRKWKISFLEDVTPLNHEIFFVKGFWALHHPDNFSILDTFLRNESSRDQLIDELIFGAKCETQDYNHPSLCAFVDHQYHDVLGKFPSKKHEHERISENSSSHRPSTIIQPLIIIWLPFSHDESSDVLTILFSQIDEIIIFWSKAERNLTLISSLRQSFKSYSHNLIPLPSSESIFDEPQSSGRIKQVLDNSIMIVSYRLHQMTRWSSIQCLRWLLPLTRLTFIIDSLKRDVSDYFSKPFIQTTYPEGSADSLSITNSRKAQFFNQW